MDSAKKVMQSKPGQKLRLNKPVTKVTLKRPAK